MKLNIVRLWAVAVIILLATTLGGAYGCNDTSERPSHDRSRSSHNDQAENSSSRPKSNGNNKNNNGTQPKNSGNNESGGRGSHATGNNKGGQKDDDANKADKDLLEFSCSEVLKTQTEHYRSFFRDGFNHYGAFLLYYQRRIEEEGLEKSKQELAFAPSASYLDKAVPKQFCTYKVREGIGKADRELKNPRLRQYWKNWCENPGNFLSWMTVPLSGGNSKKDDLSSLLLNWKGGKKLSVSFFDDGFGFFKWITDVDEQACYSGATPKHTTWCEKHP